MGRERRERIRDKAVAATFEAGQMVGSGTNQGAAVKHLAQVLVLLAEAVGLIAEEMQALETLCTERQRS